MGQAICRFLDRNPLHRPDSTGMNRVGYLTNRDTVVYQQRHKFVEVPLKQLRPKRIEAFEIKGTEVELSAIETFFTCNVLNTFLMNRGLHALAQGPRSFFDKPIKLPILRPIAESERRLRWEKLSSVLQTLDIVQVFDGNSSISRLIAAFDKGTWSHTAMYSGQNTVLEAITSGVTERPLDVYSKPGVRVGIYRLVGSSTQDAEKAIKYARQRIGNGYGWLQLFKKGVQVVFHPHQKREKFIPSPNDLIVRTDGLELVYLV